MVMDSCSAQRNRKSSAQTTNNIWHSSPLIQFKTGLHAYYDDDDDVLTFNLLHVTLFDFLAAVTMCSEFVLPVTPLRLMPAVCLHHTIQGIPFCSVVPVQWAPQTEPRKIILVDVEERVQRWLIYNGLIWL